MIRRRRSRFRVERKWSGAHFNSTMTASFTTGSHIITLKVSDPCGDSAQDTVVVRAGDSTPPTVSRPTNVTSADTGGCEARVPDVCGRSWWPVTIATLRTPWSSPSAPLRARRSAPGQYVITVTVTDAAGNAATCTTTLITVGDDSARDHSRPPAGHRIG